MATELGTAYLQIIPSAQGMKGNLTRMLAGEGDAAGTAAGKGIAGKIKKVVATAGIGAALKKSLDIGGAMEQSFGGLDTIYGDAADKAKEYAKQAYQAGVSTNTFAEQAVSFGAALKQAYEGDTAKAVEAANTAILDMTDNAAKMGTPIESIQNAYQGFAKQNYTMLDNLKLGYGGTKSEMERLLADAQKLSGVEYDISNLGDVYEAIHVIQEDLGLTGVAAAEASETFTGSFGAMKAAAENLMGNLMLGEDVKPAMEALATTTVTFIGGNLIPAVGRILTSLPEAFVTAFDNIHVYAMQAMLSLTTTIKDNIGTMIPNALEGILSFSETLRSRASSFVNVGLTLIKTIADGIIKNIPVIIQTVPTIISNFAGIINDNAPKVLATGLEIIKNLGVGLIQAIPTLIANIPKILTAIWDVFTAFNWISLGSTILNAVKNGIVSIGQSLPTTLKNIGTEAWEAFKGINWSSVGSTVINLIGKGLSALIHLPGQILRGIATKGMELFTNVSWSEVGRKVVNAIGGGITGAVSIVISAVKGMIEKIKSYFPFNIGKIFKGSADLPSVSVSKTSGGGATTSMTTRRQTFAKAMSTPYLLTKPTVFYQSIGGEAGDEIIYGRNSLMKDIKEASSGSGDITINLYYNASDDANDMVRDIARGLQRYKMAGVF